ncbi:MAG: SUKH-3 domain-containing protein [Oscillospiraceae bacterium]|nr:SUKH-3 domain-containing protein [Oscillospiraceae bacterium]
MLIEIAKQQLRKAGWYEGRKIDVSHYEKMFTELGYEFFPAARRFLEEFGDLYINDREQCDYIEPGWICVDESSTELEQLSYWAAKDCTEMFKKVGQKVVLVALVKYLSIEIYISEDGRFFASDGVCPGGYWAENTDQFWNEYYGDESGRATWEEFKAGKGRTMRKRPQRQYL